MNAHSRYVGDEMCHTGTREQVEVSLARRENLKLS